MVYHTIGIRTYPDYSPSEGTLGHAPRLIYLGPEAGPECRGRRTLWAQPYC